MTHTSDFVMYFDESGTFTGDSVTYPDVFLTFTSESEMYTNESGAYPGDFVAKIAQGACRYQD